jgi:hypothetical protein
LVVVDQSHPVTEVEDGQKLVAFERFSQIANRAVVAIVLPGTIEVVQGFPAAEPFGALVVLQGDGGGPLAKL